MMHNNFKSYYYFYFTKAMDCCVVRNLDAWLRQRYV